jgi:hypothetical protein
MAQRSLDKWRIFVEDALRTKPKKVGVIHFEDKVIVRIGRKKVSFQGYIGDAKKIVKILKTKGYVVVESAECIGTFSRKETYYFGFLYSATLKRKGGKKRMKNKNVNGGE